MKSTSKTIKILSCHGNVNVKSASLMVGCSVSQVYQTYWRYGLKKIKNPIYTNPYK